MEPVNNYPTYVMATTCDRHNDDIALRADEIGAIKQENNKNSFTIKNKLGLDIGSIQNTNNMTVKEAAAKLGEVIDLNA